MKGNGQKRSTFRERTLIVVLTLKFVMCLLFAGSWWNIKPNKFNAGHGKGSLF